MVILYKQLEREFYLPIEVDCLRQRSIEDVKVNELEGQGDELGRLQK